MSGNWITLILRKCIQNHRVYQILKVNTKLFEFEKQKQLSEKFLQNLNNITNNNNFYLKLCQRTAKKLLLRNQIQNRGVYWILKVKVKFIQFCKTKTTLKEVLVEFRHYHYIQEFLQKLCQGTLKTLILRNLIQRRRVYQILKVIV